MVLYKYKEEIFAVCYKKNFDIKGEILREGKLCLQKISNIIIGSRPHSNILKIFMQTKIIKIFIFDWWLSMIVFKIRNWQKKKLFQLTKASYLSFGERLLPTELLRLGLVYLYIHTYIFILWFSNYHWFGPVDYFWVFF